MISEIIEIRIRYSFMDILIQFYTNINCQKNYI